MGKGKAFETSERKKLDRNMLLLFVTAVYVYASILYSENYVQFSTEKSSSFA